MRVSTKVVRSEEKTQSGAFPIADGGTGRRDDSGVLDIFYCAKVKALLLVSSTATGWLLSGEWGGSFEYTSSLLFVRATELGRVRQVCVLPTLEGRSRNEPGW